MVFPVLQNLSLLFYGLYDLFSWRSWFRTPLFLGPQLLKCILQYPLLFPDIIVIYCLVLVISHAKLCFQFYTTFSKRHEINREGSLGAATMTEFLPHTLWKNKRERPGCLLTQGRGKQHCKALTCHFFQSWEKLPGQPETQEIMGWPHLPRSILTRAHQLKRENSSLHRLDYSQGKNIGTEVDIKLSTTKSTNEIYLEPED